MLPTGSCFSPWSRPAKLWGVGGRGQGLRLQDLKTPSAGASALRCGSQGSPGRWVLATDLLPPPCREGSSCFRARGDLTAPPLLSRGINSRNQLPTAAVYSLRCKPRDWAESTASLGQGCSHAAELAGSEKGPGSSPWVSRPPPLSFCHSRSPYPSPLCSWSSCWLSSICLEEILPGNLEAKAAALQRLKAA